MAPPSRRSYARGFATDAGTERALRAGLAGHDVKISRGNLDTALRALIVDAAPQLVFVDLDDHGEPENMIRRISQVCPFDTEMIAIGSADSAHVVRNLLRHDVADYLVKPISAAMIREAGAAIAGDLPRRPYAGRVVVFAGSAGSGTSTLAAAIARDLANDSYRASLVDLDPLSGKLSSLFGAPPDDRLATLFEGVDSDDSAHPEISRDLDGLRDIGVSVAPGISLIAYPETGRVWPPPSAAAARALLAHLANQTHLVLVTGITDLDVQSEILPDADARVLLFEPTLPSISLAVRRLAMLGSDSPVILVQSSPRVRERALAPSHVRYALHDRRPDVVVPFDPALQPRPDAASAAQVRPGKAYRKAMHNVIALALEGSPGTTA